MSLLVLGKLEHTVVDSLCVSFVNKQFFKPVFIVIVVTIVPSSHVVQQILDVLIIGIISVPASAQPVDLTSEKSSGADHHSVWTYDSLLIVSCGTFLKNFL